MDGNFRLDEHAARPTAEDLAARARALLPAIAARAELAERRRDLPSETIAELQSAELFKLFVPKRWGGFEADPSLLLDIQASLAEACASTSWVFGVLSVQSFMLARFDDRAQAEIWEKDGSGLASSSFQPSGTVAAVEGGYRLGGRWTFSSGSNHCRWVVLGGLVRPGGEAGRPELRLFLLPRSDYAIEDTWHTFGMRGTGSNDIVVEDAFVPAYRSYAPDDGLLPAPASTGWPALYRLPWLYVFTGSVANPGIGAARGALRAFAEIARARVSGPAAKAARDDPAVQAAIGRARSEIDVSEALLKRNLARFGAAVDSGETVPLDEALLYRSQLTSTMRKLAALVDHLVLLLGGRGIFLSSPLTRVWLDLAAARAHAGNDPTATMAALGTEAMKQVGC
jgi:3-hydroxy-9,10-secoandrosta-1,3,5(10)-triene-9,17-dione monooxygenase